VEEAPQAQHVVVASQAPLEVEVEPQGWCFQVESLQDEPHQELLEEEVWPHQEQLALPIPQEQFMVEPSPQAQPQVLV
jgi:hypothetical protein